MGDLLRQQDPQEALVWFQRGCAAVTKETAAQKAALNIGQGTVYTFLEQFEQAKATLETGLALLGPEPSQLRVTALENLGVVTADYLGDLETAITLTKEALASNEPLYDRFKEAELLSTLGAHKHQANDWPGAMVLFEQAHRLAQHLGNDKMTAMTEANLGSALLSCGAFDSALNHLANGLALFEKTDEQIRACQTMLHIAQLKIKRQAWSEAALMLSRAEQLAHDLDLDFFMPEILRLHAELALEIGDLQEAIRKAREALDLAWPSEDPYTIGLGLQVWGRVCAASERIPEALVVLEESVEKLETVDSFDAARSKALLGLLLMKNDNAELGETLLAEASATFENLGAQGELALLEKNSGR
jgi:tetratricopeptide (TPR) repeat protein